MAVNIDGTPASSGALFTATSGSVTITIGNNPNRLLVVELCFATPSVSAISVTIGATNATLVSGTDSGSGAAGNRTLVYIFTNPPTGSQTVNVSWTTASGADIGVISLFNVNQVTPTSAGTFAATTSTPGTTESITISSSTGDLTTSVCSNGGNISGTGTNQTIRWGVDSASYGGDSAAGSASNTHTWTLTAINQDVAVSGCNVKQSLTDNVDWLLPNRDRLPLHYLPTVVSVP